MSRVSKEQIQEWTENPVTLALKELAEYELEGMYSMSPTDNLIRGEPQMSQENLIESATRELEWGLFIELLSGDWTEIEEESYDEQIGNLSGGE